MTNFRILKKRNIISLVGTSCCLLLLFIFPGKLDNARAETSSYMHDSLITVRVLTAGDAMAHLPQTNAAWNADSGFYTYHDVFKWVAPVVKQYDLRIINFETTLAGLPYKGYPQFSAPDNYARDLHDAGFNFFVLANNHAVDRYTKGINRTIDVLNTLAISHTGIFKTQAARDSAYPVILNLKGITFAILNCTYGTNGIKPTSPALVNMIDKEEIKEDIQKARKSNPDLIMMVVHWGDEYRNYPNTFQKNMAAFFIEQGVDVIVGHHPHVLQPVEWRESTFEGKEKNVLIIWSLGNFYSNQRARYKNGGMFVNFDVVKNRYTHNTQIKNVTFYPFWVWKKSDPLQYSIMPCELSDSVSECYNLSSTDKMMFTTFTNDSRSHLSKNGVVKEMFFYDKQ